MQTSSKLRDHPTVGTALTTLVWSGSYGRGDVFSQGSSEAGTLRSAKVDKQPSGWLLRLVREVEDQDESAAIEFHDEQTARRLGALFETRVGKPLTQILDLQVNSNLQVD